MCRPAPARVRVSRPAPHPSPHVPGTKHVFKPVPWASLNGFGMQQAAAGRLEAGQLLQSYSPFQGNRQMKAGGMLCCLGSLLGNGTSGSSLSLDAEKFKLEALQKSRRRQSFNRSLCLIRQQGPGARQERLERSPHYLCPSQSFLLQICKTHPVTARHLPFQPRVLPLQPAWPGGVPSAVPQGVV